MLEVAKEELGFHRMRILVISPYLPHPQSGHGTGVFMHGLLQRLTARHDVTLVSFCDQKELMLAEDLKTLPMKLHTIPRNKGSHGNLILNFHLAIVRTLQFLRSIVLWQPYYVSKWRHSRLARLISHLTDTNDYDIVQFEFAIMGQHIEFVRGGKTVLHEHDVTYRPAYRRYRASKNLLQRFVLFLEWCRWNLYEPKIVQKFHHVLTVTAQDKMLLEWLTGMKHISYLPRAVDVPNAVPIYPSREPMSLLFVGTFAHAPNVDAILWSCEKIFPLVLQKFPDTIFYIIGANPPSALSKFSIEHTGIKLLGFVDDIEAYFRRCRVFLAPLRFGGGVKVKILHAMAQAIPVVTTRIGIEGIEGIHPGTVLIGDSAQKIADQICMLLENSSHAEEVGRKGWDLVKQFYSWESVITKLETIYKQVVG
jgi:glycosyltransferase involved in cell wall biosynthesis